MRARRREKKGGEGMAWVVTVACLYLCRNLFVRRNRPGYDF